MQANAGMKLRVMETGEAFELHGPTAVKSREYPRMNGIILAVLFDYTK